MNTWSAFVAGSPSLVVLHSVPPLVVFVAAEAVTDLRDKLAAALAAASTTTSQAPMTEASERPSTRQNRRMSFDDYLARAREAQTSDVAITPAWVREVTGCSRGLSSRLAATLRAESEVRT